jgi:PmbA protein
MIDTVSGANASSPGRSQEEMRATARRVVERASKQGATAADVFLKEDETFSVTVRKGEVEKLKEALSRSLRLRLFLGKRTASAQTSDLSPDVIDKLVDETIEMARLTSEDESGGLPEPTTFPVDSPDLRLVDSTWDLIKPEERIDLARRAEAAAFKASPLITNSEGGWFECERSRVVLANTAGFLGGYEATGGYLAAAPIAESNGAMQQDHWLSISRRFDQLESPEAIGRRAAERVLRRLGARKVKTCQIPVVFDPMTARTIVKHVFDAIAGDAIYRRRSFLVDQIGQSVAASAVTIVDDARLVGGLGSSPFDDEGVATQTTPIIEAGILRNYLHSAYSARKMNTRPTGNGSRTGAGAVTVGPSNFYLKAGLSTPEEIIASIEAGLYVVDLIGHGVNPVSGDYSRGVTGLWIENGKLAYPVQEVTIAGNLRHMLQDIEMIGNDVSFMGPVASPTLKIRNMTLSGE